MIYEAKYRSLAAQQELAPWHREVLSILEPLDRAQRVLEVGCGSGRLLLAMTEMGFDPLGVDVAAAAVTLCRAQGLRAERVDVEEGINVGQFDLVVCVEVLEHLFDPWHFVAQLNQCLAVGGLLILSTPNFGYWWWRWQYLRGKSPFDLQNPLHIRFFTAESLWNLAEWQGFVVRRLYGTSRWPLPDALTRRWGKALVAVLEKAREVEFADLMEWRRWS